MADVKDNTGLEGNAPYRPLDPLVFYQDRAAMNAAKAAGVERLLYKLLGSTTIGSIAFAIDPLAKFRVLSRGTSETTRKRERLRSPIINRWERVTRSRIGSNLLQPGTGGSYYPVVLGPWFNRVVSGNFAPCDQYFIPEYTIDTISRQRPKGVLGGPFECFKYSILTPRNLCEQRAYSNIAEPPAFPGAVSQRTIQETRDHIFEVPYAAMTTADQYLLLDALKAESRSQMQKNWPRMLAKCVPLAPKYDLFRAFGELKDLRGFAKRLTSFRSADDIVKYLSELREYLYKLSRSPDLYLSLEFGIKPLISDIQSVLALPANVAKRINFLMSRNGKATAYRTMVKCEPWTFSRPHFTFDTSSLFTSVKPIASSYRHDAELRMAVNATFEFPPIELPRLRDDLSSLYGYKPTFSAFYELTPWTWLIDWFSGLGDYLNLIERINGDPSLINDGYLTYFAKGEITDRQRVEWQDSSLIWEKPSSASNQTFIRSAARDATLRYSFQQRVRMSSLGVNSTLEPSSLTPFQSSIVTAILAQRIFR